MKGYTKSMLAAMLSVMGFEYAAGDIRGEKHIGKQTYSKKGNKYTKGKKHWSKIERSNRRKAKRRRNR